MTPTRPQRPAADRFMRTLLRIGDSAQRASAADARKSFQTSILVSAVRCTVMYIVFPFVLPAVGVAAGVGPWVGLAIGLVAIVSIIVSIRRFWRAEHPKRWHYTILGGAVLVFMVILTVRDIIEILG